MINLAAEFIAEPGKSVDKTCADASIQFELGRAIK
jgi:hypothetical protein